MFNKKRLLKNDTIKSEEPLALDFFDMSKVESTMLRLDISSGSVENSDSAIEFHSQIKDNCNIDALGSFIKGSSDHLYTTLYLWVYDNEATLDLFKGRTFCYVEAESRLYLSILNCLISAFDKCSQSASSSAINKLLEIQKKSGKKLLTIQLIEFNRQYLDDLYGITAETVEQALKKEFPQYKDFNYANGAVTKEAVGDFVPVFLFFTPQDLKRAELDGNIDKMTDIAYNIISQKDESGILTKERFKPQAISRRALSSKQLYDIDMNIIFRKESRV